MARLSPNSAHAITFSGPYPYYMRQCEEYVKKKDHQFKETQWDLDAR